MKLFIVLAFVVASASAIPHGGIVNTGNSAVSRSEDGHGNYAFGYNEDHATGGTFRKEKGGHGFQVGSYGLRDADGRMRVVNYVADALGYRASISTNEPGTDVKQDPAATSMTYGGHHAAPMMHAAPIAAAPIAYGGHGMLGAPIAAAPIAYGGHGIHGVPVASSYSVNTHHTSYAAPAHAALGHY